MKTKSKEEEWVARTLLAASSLTETIVVVVAAAAAAAAAADSTAAVGFVVAAGFGNALQTSSSFLDNHSNFALDYPVVYCCVGVFPPFPP